MIRLVDPGSKSDSNFKLKYGTGFGSAFRLETIATNFEFSFDAGVPGFIAAFVVGSEKPNFG